MTGTPTDTTIRLTWGDSVDDPPPSTPSGVVQYQVWRSSGAATPVQVGTIIGTQDIAPATSFMDIGLAKSTTYTYEVLALDGQNNASAFSTPVNITTLSVTPIGSLTVHNGSKGNASMQVTVYNTTTLLYYNTNGTSSPSAIGVTVSSANQGNATWTPLPVGSYVITAQVGSDVRQQAAPVTSSSNPAVSFSF